MPRSLSRQMIAPGTPDDVDVRARPAEPYTDPTCGVPLSPATDHPPPLHPLVVIGDSLSQGFKSGAGFDAELAWPALVAECLGIEPQGYDAGLEALGGLPFNLERAARTLQQLFGATIAPHEFPMLLAAIQRMLDEIEDHWERGEGRKQPAPRNSAGSNLSVFGFDIRDVLSYTSARSRRLLSVATRDNFRSQLVENAQAIVAGRVLGPAPGMPGDAQTAVARARALSEALGEPVATGSATRALPQGIETLVVMIGANNVLGTITRLRVRWSEDDFADPDRKGRYTVWRPIHFEQELRHLERELSTIRARHVIIANIPHLTIAPLAHGIGRDKYEPGSRYFRYYTRPWIEPNRFDARHHLHLTADEARAIDSAIDQYNRAIFEMVRRARVCGRDYRLLDLCSSLDRLAHRRYIDDPSARPEWWTPYILPDELAALSPVPDSRVFRSGRSGRTSGGLFSLDGVHPTTIGYGLLANEVMKVMADCGVHFAHRSCVDFSRLLERDTLMSSPPTNIDALLAMMSCYERLQEGWGRWRSAR